MTCTCISCDECGGTGSIWVSMTGKYIGKYHCDDLDELETCYKCDGSGLFEMCDECREKEEEAREEEFEQDHNDELRNSLTLIQREEIERIIKQVISQTK